MKSAIRILLGAAAVLVLVIVVRTFSMSSAVLDVPRVEIELDEDAIAGRLAEAIRFETVSPGPPSVRDPEPFRAFLSWVEETYPLVHRRMKREEIGDLSLLFTWPGADPSAAPVLVTAHYDVVPVNSGSEGDWTHPPFGGEIADGWVWGRGALDDKGAMIAILEAARTLLEEGFQPQRTIYLAFGHDEEIGGRDGAGAIAEHLRAQGVRLAWSLDEGSFVLDGAYPGVEAPVASINVAEKGYTTLDLVAKGGGGHSSIPPRETAVGVLARAILRLEENPMPGGVSGVAAQTFDALGGHMPFLYRIPIANRWLLGGALEAALGGSAATNAILRTTTAPTMLEGSVKENVLPTEAVATVNFRIHPRDSFEDVVAHVRRVVDDDRIELRIRRRGNEASEVASTTASGYRTIARSVAEVFGPVVVVPGLTVGGTDSRHYGRVADDAYRLNPMVVTLEDVEGFHGTNERISIENLAQATRAYARIFFNAGSPQE